jgi:hypothetical protein
MECRCGKGCKENLPSAATMMLFKGSGALVSASIER